MKTDFHFNIRTTRFDENYQPSCNTRLTTNFANLARGIHREENLRKTLGMIDSRLNELAHWDNPLGNRYSMGLEIISVDLKLEEARDPLPLIEFLKTSIHDRTRNKRIEGIVGNSFSSYVRDYDFSILLPSIKGNSRGSELPENFGELHGGIFKNFLSSTVYKQHFSKPPVICISVSTSKTYQRTLNQHPVLGFEYRQSEASPTDLYFEKMGMKVRFFMPPRSTAPLAIYFCGDLLDDYTNLELIGTISTMETFQKIYRPEIYNANIAAGATFQASLVNQNYSSTQVHYDRDERRNLAIEQGKYTEENFIKPYSHLFDKLTRPSTNQVHT